MLLRPQPLYPLHRIPFLKRSRGVGRAASPWPGRTFPLGGERSVGTFLFDPGRAVLVPQSRRRKKRSAARRSSGQDGKSAITHCSVFFGRMQGPQEVFAGGPPEAPSRSGRGKAPVSPPSG